MSNKVDALCDYLFDAVANPAFKSCLGGSWYEGRRQSGLDLPNYTYASYIGFRMVREKKDSTA